MSWAMIGFAALSYYGGKKTSKEQKKLDTAVLKLEQDKYNRWLSIYGNLEENLGKYYEGLDPDTFAAQGLQQEAEAFSKATIKVKDYFAQRGLTGSGLEASTLAESEFKSAENKAQIRFNAPHQVAQMKQGFVQGKPAPTGVEDTYRAMADREAQSAQSLYSSAGQLLSTGLENFARETPSIQKANEGMTLNENPYNYNEVPA